MQAATGATEDIVASLYEGALDEGAWRRGLNGIAKLVGGEGPALISIAPDSGAVLRFDIGDLDAAAFDVFQRDWAHKDIRVPAGVLQPLYKPATEKMILPRGAWEKSEVFNEYMLSVGWGWFLSTWIHKSPTAFTCLSIQAGKDRGPFGPEDVESIERLMPHVRRALDIKDRLASQQIRAESLRLAADRSSFGVAVVDAQGCLMDVSTAAMLALESANVLKRQSSGVFALSEPTGGQLRQLIASVMQSGALSDGMLQVRRPHGRKPLGLVLAPVSNAVAPWCTNAARWLLFIFDPEQHAPVSRELLMADLGLTEREAEIASLLTEISDLRQVATRLQIGLGTVRSHVKAIYAKTGERCRADLVRRIVSGPAWNAARCGAAPACTEQGPLAGR